MQAVVYVASVDMAVNYVHVISTRYQQTNQYAVFYALDRALNAVPGQYSYKYIIHVRQLEWIPVCLYIKYCPLSNINKFNAWTPNIQITYSCISNELNTEPCLTPNNCIKYI